MKTIRKGIALVLLAALCLGNALSAAAAPLPSEPSAQEETAGAAAQAPEKDAPLLTTSQSTTLTAEVSAGATYSVRIPEQVSLGSLPASGDFNSPYSIDVTMHKGDTGTVSVRSEQSVDLLPDGRSGADALPCHNRFADHHFTESGSAEGLLTIYGEDIRAAKPGSYSGTLNFYLSYTPGTTPDPSEPTDPTDPSDPVSPTNPPEPIDPTDPVSPTEPSGPVDPTVPDDGSVRYTATVTMRKENAFQEMSMCNGLFHRKADIVVKDGIATLTMYVIDPVPNFAADGTPLSNVSLHYNGKNFSASTDTAHRVMKHFDAVPSFVPADGSYAATPVVVELPEQALKDSVQQKLTCTAFVEAVMKTNVNFFVVLEDLTEVEKPEPTVPVQPTDPTAPVNPSPTDPPAQPQDPTPVAPGGDSGNIGPSTNGTTYYTATITMRKENAFGTYSMCNPLFHRKADIAVNGDTATLTIYVIDPVPKFPNDGTPLSKVSMHYEGKNYPARINSSSKVSKSFAAQPGFIETAGNYPASSLVVQLPVQALKDSMNQKLTCTAYVNAVMKRNVNFFVALSDLTQTSGAPSNQAASGGGPAGSGAEEADPTGEAVTLTMGTDPKTWFESSVSMRRADDFESPSMCNPLFYEKADIAFSGDLAELTLYVIDPVPKFADEGTPLSDVAFLYEGKSYAATAHPDQQVTKHFPMAPGFIPSEGEYTATPVTVVLPRQAIEDSLQQKLMCSGYINTVMHTTQKFFVVLDDLTETDGPAADSSSEPTVPVGVTGAQQPGSASEQAPAAIRIDTRLFPQILGYLLFTAVVLGGSFALIWYRRNGKD